MSSLQRSISLLSLYKLIKKTLFSLRWENSRKAGLDISRIFIISILEGGEGENCLGVAFRAGDRGKEVITTIASYFSICFRFIASCVAMFLYVEL